MASKYKRRDQYEWENLDKQMIKCCERAATKAARMWDVDVDDMFQEAVLWTVPRMKTNKALNLDNVSESVASHYIYRNALRPICARSTWYGMTGTPSNKAGHAIPANDGDVYHYNAE